MTATPRQTPTHERPYLPPDRLPYLLRLCIWRWSKVPAPGPENCPSLSRDTHIQEGQHLPSMERCLIIDSTVNSLRTWCCLPSL